MKVVIDSNRLRSQELRSYLAQSRSNKAVLIDYASIEAYKKNADKTIGRSMAILGEFPAQVLVLQSTGAIYKLDPRKPNMTGRMVWPEHTKTFGLFVKQLNGIETGAPSAWENVQYLEHQAQTLLADRNEVARAMPDLYEGWKDLFTVKQHRLYRNTGVPPQDALDVILGQARDLAALRVNDRFDEAFDLGNALNHFAIRHALCNMLQMWEWVRHGGPKDLPEKRRENDAADSIFVTYGSYFNGLMTGDVAAAALHRGLRDLLRRVGGTRPGRARMPGPYRPA